MLEGRRHESAVRNKPSARRDGNADPARPAVGSGSMRWRYVRVTTVALADTQVAHLRSGAFVAERGN